jgi:hypothetical protein
MTAASALHRPRLVSLCKGLVVSLAFLIAVSLFLNEGGIEGVLEVEVQLRGSISPRF